MTRKEAYDLAVAALDDADREQGDLYVKEGGGWGDWDSAEIYLHIKEKLRKHFNVE